MAEEGAKDASTENAQLVEQQSPSIWVKWVVIASVVALWIGSGMWFGCMVEGWSFVTALYVMIQVITTIGYGDITFDTQEMKIAMTFYILIGVMILAGLLSNIADDILNYNTAMVRRAMTNVEAKIRGKDPEVMDSYLVTANKLVGTTCLFAFFIAAGTVFYALYEPCSCSYGRTKIEGCVEGPKCPETGGATKSWIESFYMSVITLTTVGFGDHTPKTWWGRVFGIFWMFLGVSANAAFITACSDMIIASEQKDEKQKLEKIDRETFNKIDENKNGTIEMLEFRHFALAKLGYIKPEDLDMIDELFDTMDKDKSGYLTWEEIQKQFEPKQ